MTEKGERKLIDWIRRQRSADPAAVPIGIGDDMAGLNLAGQGLVLITTDIRLDGVHFRTECGTGGLKSPASGPLSPTLPPRGGRNIGFASPRQIGYKAFACSLSDAAAMASLPRAAVAAVALPRDWSMQQAQELTGGMLELADRFRCPLVGGDVTSWDQPLAINVTLISTESGIPAVRRSGAQPGDAILVTGELGGSLASGRHLTFPPRVDEARALASAVRLHSMIDLSDGLSTDLRHICDESNVGAIVQADCVPISPAAWREEDSGTRRHGDTGTRGTEAVPASPRPRVPASFPAALNAALNDGEDFELCFTCSAEDAEALLAHPPIDVSLTRIGQITAGPGHWLMFPDGRREPLVAAGYEHFR